MDGEERADVWSGGVLRGGIVEDGRMVQRVEQGDGI